MPLLERRGAVAALVFVGTFLLFAPALALPFIRLDDVSFVTANPIVKNGLTFAGLHYAFTTHVQGNYTPLALLSHMIDVELFGSNALGHHASSVVLHSVTATLVFLLWSRLLRLPGLAVFLALAFALHPLRVESVAWVAERRDVLCGAMFLGALVAYCRFVEVRTTRSYALVLALSACALLSKAMAITLPCVLVLLDAWPLQRFSREPVRRLVVEKLPIVLLTLPISVVTLLAQEKHPLEDVSLGHRLETSAVAVMRYLELTAVPHDLAVLYPMPKSWPTITLVTAIVVVVAGVCAAWFTRRSFPAVAVGLAWFVGMLVPVIGLVSVGRQAYADRYTYLPSIGLVVAVAYPATRLMARGRLHRNATLIVAWVWLGFCAWSTQEQIGTWTSNEALFGNALRVTTDNELAHVQYARARYELGDFAGALPHLEKAVSLSPSAFNYNRLSLCLLRLGRVDDAVERAIDAVSVEPQSGELHADLGLALMERGEIDAGLRELAIGAQLAPTDRRIAVLRADALKKAGRDDEAAAERARADAPRATGAATPR